MVIDIILVFFIEPHKYKCKFESNNSSLIVSFFALTCIQRCIHSSIDSMSEQYVHYVWMINLNISGEVWTVIVEE